MPDDSRTVNEMMRISEDPTEYDPRAGDVLEWCGHIRIEVDHVTPDGHVSLNDIPPNESGAARIYPDDDRPEGDPNRHPPLGITTWASKHETVSIEDCQRLLRHGWDLKQTR